MNVHEELARERKAMTIALSLWWHASDEMRDTLDFAARAQEMTDEWWAAAAEVAGANVPSVETRLKVVYFLRDLQSAHRRQDGRS